MIKLAPSILSADFANLQRDIAKVEVAGADYIHIDVMDGSFVPNITIGSGVVKAIRQYSDSVFDVHLMINDPEKHIKDFIDAGADIITIHMESTKHVHRALQIIRQAGKKAGIALNPATPVNSLEYILDDIDMIVIMSVNPGFGGQKFIETTYKKLNDVINMIGTRKIDIEVDGGVNLDNIAKIKATGATVLVAGSAIYNSDDIAGTIKKMRKVCE